MRSSAARSNVSPLLHAPGTSATSGEVLVATVAATLMPMKRVIVELVTDALDQMDTTILPRFGDGTGQFACARGQ